MAYSVRLMGLRDDGERTWLVEADWWHGRGLLGHKHFKRLKGSPGYETDEGATLTLSQARDLNDRFGADALPFMKEDVERLATRLAEDNAEGTRKVESWIFEWESGL